MGWLVLLVFLAVPIAEWIVIAEVTQWLGLLPTLVVLVADSVVGALLVRQEGSRTWRRFTLAVGEGRAPSKEIVDGALILFGGALLLTPGFITDAVGLACVLAPTRALLNRAVRARASALTGLGQRGPFVVFSEPRRTRRADRGERDAIEVEVIEVERSEEPRDQ